MFKNVKDPFAFNSKSASFSKTLNSSFNRTTNTSNFSFRSDSVNFSNSQSLPKYESQNHFLYNCGSVLPVLVVEAISTVSEVSSRSSVSVKISESGWAWLVCGRRVFVWKYKQTASGRSSSCVCYELQLPPSDLSHKAELICLLTNSSNQIPGLVSVSPEGTVRYWPSIAYNGHSIETLVTDLQGQEYFSLTNIQPLGCLLATTTSSLVHIVINSGAAGSVLLCRTLKVPQGMFAGISRRVSSFIFGAIPAAQSSEIRQLIKVVKCLTEENEVVIYVLAGYLLQKWIILNSYSETLLFEYDLDRGLRDLFLDNNVWNCETTHPNQLQIWLIDIEVRKPNELFLLVAALNAEVSSQLFYAVVILEVTVGSNFQSPIRFKSFTCLKNTHTTYSPEDEEKLLNLKILSVPDKELIYVYNPFQILCVQFENDVINVEDDTFLGAGVCGESPIFFTAKEGLLSLESKQNLCVFGSEQISIENEAVNVEDDESTILKKAFSIYKKLKANQKEINKSKVIVTDYFLKNNEDTSVNETVVNFSARLCDETPQLDPRWAETCNAPNFPEIPRLILNQLEEKLRSHHLFTSFLKDTGIWDKLGTVTINGTKVATQFLLCEHSEKLVFAIALRKIDDKNHQILTSAIKNLVTRRGEDIPMRLIAEDIFYKEVTKVDEVLPVLIELQDEEIGKSLLSSKQALNSILSVCTIIVTCLEEVRKYRQQSGQLSGITRNVVSSSLWTSSSKPNGVHSTLMKEFEIIVEYGLNSKTAITEESGYSKNMIFQKLVDLVDIVLNSYIYQLSCVQNNTEMYRSIESAYKTDRSRCIEPLISAKQYERAVSLAEKYEDFDILIRICEELDNNERLQRYSFDFKEKGFSEYLFKWYMKEGKLGKMLSSSASELGSFLKEYKNLEWIHQIGLDQFGEASKSLRSLAFSDEYDVSRKRTLLSLGKLCALADEHRDTTAIAELNEDLSALENSSPL